jgi:hypothetical protein
MTPKIKLDLRPGEDLKNRDYEGVPELLNEDVMQEA